MTDGSAERHRRGARTHDAAAALHAEAAQRYEQAGDNERAMLERGNGDIVSIGSVADHRAFPENAAYGASKHGLRALHDVLRAELHGTGVRVTLVSPGPVDTSLWDEIDPDSREGFTPRSRMLPPNAVAAAVLFAVTQPADVDVELIRLSRS